MRGGGICEIKEAKVGYREGTRQKVANQLMVKGLLAARIEK
jgi:hypothetical protein